MEFLEAAFLLIYEKFSQERKEIIKEYDSPLAASQTGGTQTTDGGKKRRLELMQRDTYGGGK